MGKSRDSFVASALAAAPLTLLSAGAITACSTKVSDESLRWLAAGDAQRRMARNPNAILILDSRSRDEFEAGHIPGARQMDLADVDPEEPDPSLKRYATIVVYGQDPGSVSAKTLAKKLLSAGLKGTQLLEGGFAAWKEQGLPVEVGAAAGNGGGVNP